VKKATITFMTGVEESDDENQATCRCGEPITHGPLPGDTNITGWYHAATRSEMCKGVEDEQTAAPTDEVEHELPAVFAVCPRCDGHGTHLTPSIGNYAYSSEEFEEAFHDDEDREAYFKRGGKYDVECERCHGKNVVPVVDRAACVRDPKLAALLAKYEDLQNEERAYQRECAAEMRAEMGFDYY
jgi:hypothetical protein